MPGAAEADRLMVVGSRVHVVHQRQVDQHHVFSALRLQAQARTLPRVPGLRDPIAVSIEVSRGSARVGDHPVMDRGGSAGLAGAGGLDDDERPDFHVEAEGPSVAG